MVLIKTILLGGAFLYAMNSAPHHLEKMRALYLQAGVSERACKELLAFAKANETTADVLTTGYRGAASMIMAKFAGNPFSKISWFRQGRTMLEKAIRASGGCPELRYLRYCVQTHCPRFLGYHRDIESDRACLQLAMTGGADGELKEMIRAALTPGR